MSLLNMKTADLFFLSDKNFKLDYSYVKEQVIGVSRSTNANVPFFLRWRLD